MATLAQNQTIEQTVIVAFNGASLVTAKVKEAIYVALRPVVEALGLDWASQSVKLNKDKARYGCCVIATPSNGGVQDMLFIPLRKLNGWLFSINPSKVREDLRERVVQYQEECFEVLYRYWQGEAVQRPYQMPLPTMSDKRTRVPVKDAVTLLVAKSRNMNYSEAYGMIHQRFNVDSVEDLTNEQLPQVIEYIHKVVCEFIGKAELPAPKTQNILAETLQSITIMQGQVDYWQVRDALKQLTAILNQYQPYAHVRQVIILLETIERMMMRLWSMIDEAKQHASIFHTVFKTGKPLTTSNMDTLVSMESLLSRNMMVLQMPQYQSV